jgi:hypothetical protein
MQHNSRQTKQSKAKQSKAKQSKAKQSKAKQLNASTYMTYPTLQIRRGQLDIVLSSILLSRRCFTAYSATANATQIEVEMERIQ